MIADPVGGSGDGSSPVSWVVEEREREREVRSEGELDRRHHERESESGVRVVVVLGERGVKAFGLVPVEPVFWHAAFQELNTTVFPFTPPPPQIHIQVTAARPNHPNLFSINLY